MYNALFTLHRKQTIAIMCDNYSSNLFAFLKMVLKMPWNADYAVYRPLSLQSKKNL